MTMRRSLVVPKLVSNGFTSRMRNSRSSTCRMNTVCSPDKHVFVRLRLVLECDGMEIFCQVLLKFHLHALLKASGGMNVELLQHLYIRMNGNPANVTSYGFACAVQPPFGDDAIGGQSALNTAGVSVEVRIVTTDNDAKLLEIEIRVARFQRIECPLDQGNAALNGVFALCKLEPCADS